MVEVDKIGGERGTFALGNAFTNLMINSCINKLQSTSRFFRNYPRIVLAHVIVIRVGFSG
jgi:hypothetical protein